MKENEPLKYAFYFMSIAFLSLSFFTYTEHKELLALQTEKGIQYQTSVRLIELYTDNSYLELSDDERISTGIRLITEASRMNSYGGEWVLLSNDIQSLGDYLLTAEKAVTEDTERKRELIHNQMVIINDELEDDPITWFKEFNTLDDSASKYFKD